MPCWKQLAEAGITAWMIQWSVESNDGIWQSLTTHSTVINHQPKIINVKAGSRLSLPHSTKTHPHVLSGISVSTWHTHGFRLTGLFSVCFRLSPPKVSVGKSMGWLLVHNCWKAGCPSQSAWSPLDQRCADINFLNPYPIRIHNELSVSVHFYN